jgi:hypothetical protein
MARLVEDNSDDGFPEVSDILPSSKSTTGRDVIKNHAATTLISRQQTTRGSKNNKLREKENQLHRRGKKDIETKPSEIAASKPKSRKRILKQTTDNPLLRPLTCTTTASSSEVSVRKASAKTVFIEEKEIIKPKKAQSSQTKKMKSKPKRIVEESESEGMSDFIVSDNDSCFVVENSDEDDEEEEVVKTPPRSVRRLVRGRRPMREKTPEEDLDEMLERLNVDSVESGEEDDLAVRIKKLSIDSRDSGERTNPKFLRERSDDTGSKKFKSKKEPPPKKKSQASSTDLDNPFSLRL